MKLQQLWKVTTGIMVSAFVLGSAWATSVEAKVIMRYSHSSGAMVEEPHHMAALNFKEHVEKATNGEVEVQIYPASQLGGEERNYQDIQHQVIHAASLAVNNVTPFSPSMGVFDLPYMFTSYDECYKVVDQNWDAINERLIKESGNMAVGWLVQGFRVVSNSKHPILTMDDLKGLKIRVPNNLIMIETFRALGGEPAPMTWDETFNALQQKVVDGQENPYPVFASNKFEEVQKYITEIHYKLWIGPIVVNATWFKNQKPEIQKAILEAGRVATDNNRTMIVEMEARLKNQIKESGVEIVDKVENEDAWVQASMSIWPRFYDSIGDITLLDTFMNTLGRKRPE